MSYEFINLNKEVNILAVNKADGLDTQDKLVEQCTFPLLQDTEEVDAWTLLNGGKDDFYVYSPDGVLAVHLPSGGTVPTNLSSGAGYANLRNTVLAVIEQYENPSP